MGWLKTNRRFTVENRVLMGSGKKYVFNAARQNTTQKIIQIMRIERQATTQITLQTLVGQIKSSGRPMFANAKRSQWD